MSTAIDVEDSLKELEEFVEPAPDPEYAELKRLVRKLRHEWNSYRKHENILD